MAGGAHSALPVSSAEMNDVSFYSERKGFVFGETGQVISYPSYSSPVVFMECEEKQARRLGSVFPVLQKLGEKANGAIFLCCV